MFRNTLYSYGVLLIVAFICNNVSCIGAAEFDDLTDEQKGAAMALLKQAMNEIKIDPLDLIRKGMEKVKEEHEMMAMNDEPQTQSSSTIPMDQSILPPTSSSVEFPSIVPATEPDPSTRLSDIQPVETATATNIPEVITPTSFANVDASSTVNFEPESTTKEFAEPKLSETFDEPALISTITPKSTTRASPVATKRVTQSSGPTTGVETIRGNNVILEEVKTAEPTDVNYENVYIDDSDPRNPKRVHIKKHSKSKFDDNGFSHHHRESKISTSINDNSNVFSKHSSSFSSSGSSNTFVNGKKVNPMDWTYNSMKPFSTIAPIAKIPGIQPLTSMSTMPSMPIMPFGTVMAGTWPGYFNQNYEGLGFPLQAPVYASAYAGLPENFFGVPNNQHMSRRQAKKLAKKQERAARRAFEHDYYN